MSSKLSPFLNLEYHEDKKKKINWTGFLILSVLTQ
uniref:Uncharacterized protein n=1 Tax=Anguilla anguilla TaxID=7936 RepID=A0A0E9PBS1_ANGAN